MGLVVTLAQIRLPARRRPHGADGKAARTRAGCTYELVSWSWFQAHLCPVTTTQLLAEAAGSGKDLKMRITPPHVSDSKRAVVRV